MGNLAEISQVERGYDDRPVIAYQVAGLPLLVGLVVRCVVGLAAWVLLIEIRR